MVAAPTPRKSPNSCQGMQSPNLQGRAKGEGLWSQRNVSSGSTSPRRCWTSPSCRTWTQWSVPNTPQGIDELVAALGSLAPVLVVMESTGGLQRAVVAGLAAAQIPTAVVNPRQVRDFAKASGRLAKTDRLDAEVIARFGMAIRPRPTRLPDAEAQALEAQLGAKAAGWSR